MFAFSKVDLRAMSWPHSAKCIAHGELFQGFSKVRDHSTISPSAWCRAQGGKRRADYLKLFWKFVIILRYRRAHGAESRAESAERTISSTSSGNS